MPGTEQQFVRDSLFMLDPLKEVTSETTWSEKRSPHWCCPGEGDRKEEVLDILDNSFIVYNGLQIEEVEDKMALVI